MKNIIEYIKANKNHLDEFNLEPHQRRILESRISMIMADMLFDVRDEVDKSWIRLSSFWVINGVLKEQVDRMENEIRRLEIEKETIKSLNQ